MVPFLPICFYFGDSQDRPPSIFISSYFLFVCFVDSIWLAFDGGFAFCVCLFVRLFKDGRLATLLVVSRSFLSV